MRTIVRDCKFVIILIGFIVCAFFAMNFLNTHNTTCSNEIMNRYAQHVVDIGLSDALKKEPLNCYIFIEMEECMDFVSVVVSNAQERNFDEKEIQPLLSDNATACNILRKNIDSFIYRLHNDRAVVDDVQADVKAWLERRLSIDGEDGLRKDSELARSMDELLGIRTAMLMPETLAPDDGPAGSVTGI